MPGSTRELLVEGAHMLGVHLSPAQADLFERYRGELMDWNRKFNLTGLEDARSVTVKHFLDSLSIALAVEIRGGQKILDVGTGAGLPGLPVKIWQPRVELWLLEAAGKPVRFLQHLCQELNLAGVTVLQGRAEEWGRKAGFREEFDGVLTRAVAPLAVVFEYGLPFLRPGGWMVAFKGPRVREEMDQGKVACRVLGGEVDRTVELSLPFHGGDRVLVVARKVAPTPGSYPRRTGIPSRRPLGEGKFAY